MQALLRRVGRAVGQYVQVCIPIDVWHRVDFVFGNIGEQNSSSFGSYRIGLLGDEWSRWNHHRSVASGASIDLTSD